MAMAMAIAMDAWVGVNYSPTKSLEPAKGVSNEANG